MRHPSLILPLLLLCACASAGADTVTPRSRTSPTPRPDAGARRDASPSPSPPPSSSCPSGASTVVSGVVRFPNGTLPVSGAFVYIPAGSAADVPRSGDCGECVDGASVSAHTNTGPDGRFELRDVAAGARQVVIEKGKFRRVAEVEITECVTNELADDSVRLPRDASEGDVPHIAVVTGEYDRMESVLDQLGLSRSAVDIYASSLESGASGDQAGALLRDGARLATYDILLVNCGAWVTDYEGVSTLTAAVRDNLSAFVEAGGRLYATDLSYDIVEITNPEMADFYGGSGDGLSSTAERLGDAEIGDPVDSVVATVEDEDLRAWLAVNGALSGSTTMNVDGMLDGWALIERANPSRTKTWVSASVEWGSWVGSPQRGVRPLTVSTEQGCGRTLFSSYHTVEGRWGGSGGLVGQELALAYLLLEIGSCVQDPVLY